MIIDKNFRGLVDEGYRYKIAGDIYTTESLIIELDKQIYVTGSIKAGGCIDARRGYIEAGGYIESGEYIDTRGSIKAGGYIDARESIKAGGDIKAGGYIKAGKYFGISAGLQIVCNGKISLGLNIFAGICTWKKTTEYEKTIYCSGIEGGGTVGFGILKIIKKPKTYKIVIDNKEIELSEENYNTIKEILL